MGLRSLTKEEKRLAEEKEKLAMQALIAETAKPPEKSTFSKWRVFGVPIAIGAVALAGFIYASQKKNGQK